MAKDEIKEGKENLTKDEKKAEKAAKKQAMNQPWFSPFHV